MKKSVIRKQISSFAAVFFRWFFVVGVGWPWNATFDRSNTYVKWFSCPAPTPRPKSVHLTWYVILPERVHHRHTMCHHDTSRLDVLRYIQFFPRGQFPGARCNLVLRDHIHTSKRPRGGSNEDHSPALIKSRNHDGILRVHVCIYLQRYTIPGVPHAARLCFCCIVLDIA